MRRRWLGSRITWMLWFTCRYGERGSWVFKKRDDGMVDDCLYCQKRKLCCKLNSPCVYYLRTQNPYKEKKRKNCCQFVNKLYSRYQISSCECSMCLHCVCKVTDVTVKDLVQVELPIYALSEKQKSL